MLRIARAAASDRTDRLTDWRLWADCVEKLEKSALSFFRPNPVHRKSWTYSRREGCLSCTHRQSIDLADPLTKISNLRSMLKFFIVFR